MQSLNRTENTRCQNLKRINLYFLAIIIPYFTLLSLLNLSQKNVFDSHIVNSLENNLSGRAYFRALFFKWLTKCKKAYHNFFSPTLNNQKKIPP